MFKRKEEQSQVPTVVVVREHERSQKDEPKKPKLASLRKFIKSRRYKSEELREAEDMSDLFEARKEVRDATLASQRGD